MSVDSSVIREVSEKAWLSLIIRTLTGENGTLALPNFQGTTSYDHSTGFLLPALKQYLRLFSLDELHKILWFSLSDLFCIEEPIFVFSPSSYGRLSIILINLDTSTWTFWKILENVNTLSVMNIMSAMLGFLSAAYPNR